MTEQTAQHLEGEAKDVCDSNSPVVNRGTGHNNGKGQARRRIFRIRVAALCGRYGSPCAFVIMAEQWELREARHAA